MDTQKLPKLSYWYRSQQNALIMFIMVTAKLISAFVFATRIVQFLFYLNPKFQAPSFVLCLYRLVCVGPVRKQHSWFSHEAAQMVVNLEDKISLLMT